jgi:hypothetical protein
MNKRYFLIMLLGTLVPLVVLIMIFLFKIPVNTGAYLGLTVLWPLILFFMRNEKGHVQGNGLQAAHVYIEIDNQK